MDALPGTGEGIHFAELSGGLPTLRSGPDGSGGGVMPAGHRGHGSGAGCIGQLDIQVSGPKAPHPGSETIGGSS